MRIKIILALFLLNAIPAQAKEKLHNYDYYDGGVPHVPARHEGSSSSEARLEVSPQVYSVAKLIISGDNGKEIGNLDWSTGKLVFTGEADKAARRFFNKMLKPMVDVYIKEKLLTEECHE